MRLTTLGLALIVAFWHVGLGQFPGRRIPEGGCPGVLIGAMVSGDRSIQLV